MASRGKGRHHDRSQLQKEKTVSAWRQLMTSLYPDLLTRTICVPPVIVNRVPYSRDTVAGQPVLVVQKPHDSFNTAAAASAATASGISTMGHPVLTSSLPPAIEAWVNSLFTGIYSRVYNYMFTPGSGENNVGAGQASSSQGDARQNASSSIISDKQQQSDTVTQDAVGSQNPSTSGNQPPSQSQSQPQNQPQNQSHNQPPSQPQNQPPSQPQNQPPSQSQNQPPSQSQNQPPSRPQNKRPSQPQYQPPSQPQNQPPIQSLSQPSCQSQYQPSCQPQNQPPSQPQNQPQNQPPSQPQNQPPSQPQNQPPSQSQNQPSCQPQNQPPSQSLSQPSCQPQYQPSCQPQNQPQIQSLSQPSCQPQNQPSCQPQNQPPSQSQSQPQNQSQNQPSCQSQNQPQSHSQNQSQAPSQPQTQTPYSIWSRDPNPNKALKPVYDSDARDDFAQQHVLTNLQALGNTGHEVMFILSQLNFTNYLKDLPSPKAANWFPRPASLGKNYADGDFDLLVIHRHYGILIGEIKSVGMVQRHLKKTQIEMDADIVKKIWRAIQKQLDKSEHVVIELVRDIAPSMLVRKTLILPFVTDAQLLSILSQDPQLCQALCTCLGAADAAEATRLCLCRDQLSDPATSWNVTQADLSHLSAWWQQRMACTVDNSIADEMYLDIVARFAGPATTVTVQCSVPPRLQIRTRGDAVSFLGDTFAHLVLTAEQVDLLNRAPRRVYLKGPPGTGKTVTLALMGLRWILEGHDVHVVSFSYETRAVAELICNQIKTTAALYASVSTSSSSSSSSSSPSMGRVHLMAYDGTVDFSKQLLKMAGDVADMLRTGGVGPHRFICDEIMFGKNSAMINHWSLNLAVWNLEMVLHSQYIWMAGVTNHNMPPSIHEALFTTPLRCAPAIQREVQAGLDQWSLSGATFGYVSNGIPAPSDGLSVIRLQHNEADHGAVWPVDCVKCGENIADLLNQQLNVGGPAHIQGATTATNAAATPSSKKATPWPTPLQYKDVFVVTRSSDLHDDVTDDVTGRVVTPASGVVQGLRQAGIPVYVLGAASPRSDRAKCHQIVTGMGTLSFDRVVASFSPFLQGLERKVVVWLPGENHCLLDEYIVEKSEVLDRVHAVSRCTTQLVIVELPSPLEPQLD